MIFDDRVQAGRLLAERLERLDPDAVVLGLPRGGVPVAYEVAAALGAPLDVLLVRKVGVPTQPELAMGAVGEGGVEIRNEDVLRHVVRHGFEGDDRADEVFESVAELERVELAARVKRYRGGRPQVDLAGRTAVIIDDGAATGATARAACEVARAQGARRVVLALPVAPPETIRFLAEAADEVVCLHTPRGFMAVGQYYRDFSQTTDSEVTALLKS